MAVAVNTRKAHEDAPGQGALNACFSLFCASRRRARPTAHTAPQPRRIMQRVQCKRKRWHLRRQAATLPENHLTRKAALPASSLCKLFWVIRLQEL